MDDALRQRIDDLLSDGCSVGQAMDAAGCTEADVRHVKRLRDERATPPPRTRQPWETGW